MVFVAPTICSISDNVIRNTSLIFGCCSTHKMFACRTHKIVSSHTWKYFRSAPNVHHTQLHLLVPSRCWPLLVHVDQLPSAETFFARVASHVYVQKMKVCTWINCNQKFEFPSGILRHSRIHARKNVSSSAKSKVSLQLCLPALQVHCVSVVSTGIFSPNPWATLKGSWSAETPPSA